MIKINIIEKTKEILLQFPQIALVCNDINIDFAENAPTSYGLSSVGDTLLLEDILGNQKRQHSFILYSTFSGINDFERMTNSEAITNLSIWLSKQMGAEITTELDGIVHTGEITAVSTGGGTLYEVPQGNVIKGLRYQLQIEVQYAIEF